MRGVPIITMAIQRQAAKIFVDLVIAMVMVLLRVQSAPKMMDNVSVTNMSLVINAMSVKTVTSISPVETVVNRVIVITSVVLMEVFAIRVLELAFVNQVLLVINVISVWKLITVCQMRVVLAVIVTIKEANTESF